MSANTPDNSKEQMVPPSKEEFLGVVSEIASTLHVDHSDPDQMTDEQLEAETAAVQKMGEMLQQVPDRLAFVTAIRNEFFESYQANPSEEAKEILYFLSALVDGEDVAAREQG